MENKPPEKDSSTSSGNNDDASTGLPGLTSWRAVYAFVLGFFTVVVIVLVALSRMYS